MTDTSPARLGQINNAGDQTAIALRVFSGEVLVAYENARKTKGKIYEQTITSGKSAQFAKMGSASASFYSAGEDILDNSNGYLAKIPHAQTHIAIDKFLLAAEFIDDLDEMLMHYEQRGRIAMKLGEALAQQDDQRVYEIAVQAALTADAETYTGEIGGTVIDIGAASAAAVTTTQLRTAFKDAATAFMEKSVPTMGGWHMHMNPSFYNAFVDGETDVISSDFTAGANGGLDTGTAKKFFDWTLDFSNNLPASTNRTSYTDNQISTTAAATAKNDYSIDMRNVVAIGWQADAVGCVKREGLNVTQHEEPRLNGKFLRARQANGYGKLRTSNAVVIRWATP